MSSILLCSVTNLVDYKESYLHSWRLMASSVGICLTLKLCILILRARCLRSTFVRQLKKIWCLAKVREDAQLALKVLLAKPLFVLQLGLCHFIWLPTQHLCTQCYFCAKIITQWGCSKVLSIVISTKFTIFVPNEIYLDFLCLLDYFIGHKCFSQ